jgi:hypothetical protein
MLIYLAGSYAWISGAEHTADDVDDTTVAGRALTVANNLSCSLL